MLQQRISRSLQLLVRQQRQCGRLPRTPFATSSISQYAIAPSIAQRLPGRRWYSQAQEAEKKDESTAEATKVFVDEGQNEGQKTVEEAAKKADDPLQKELDAKKQEVLDVTDRLKRTIADYRNLQEQTKREIAASRDFALQRFSKDLLDSIDNLDRALINVPADKLTSDNQDLLNLHSGLKMTETILMNTLKKHGLERFDPSDPKAEGGNKFDPNRHEAVFQAPQKDKEDGSVFYTQQKGFLLNGRVLRAAKVGVVKNS